MDEFKVIKARRSQGFEMLPHHQDWLIAELERAYLVEDAAIALDRGYAEFGDFPDDVSAWGDRVDDLSRAIELNPRPEASV